MSNRKSLNPILKNLGNLPPLLYKYRSFDKEGFGVKMATEGQVYFPSARILNDPFENYFIPKSEFTDLPDPELKQYLYKKTKQNFPKLDRWQRKKLERAAFKRAMIHRRDPAVAAEELLEMQYEKFGILSLVKDCSSLPMWAYYSENHEGICIGLKTEIIANHQRKLLEEKGTLIALHNVTYTDEIPHINIDTPLDGDTSDEGFDESEAVHCTKSIHWKHEDEIRLIMWEHPNTAYSFGPEAVGEVVIGINAKEENIAPLLNELRRIKSNAVVKQAVKSKRHYGLSFEEIQF